MEKISEIKRLYKDALYFYLVRKGYTTKQAELAVERIFNTE